MVTNTNILIYENTKELPYFFSDEDLSKIARELLNYRKYPDGEWGNFCKSRTFMIFMISATMGLRTGEVCGLLKDDIDFKENTLRVRSEWNKCKSERVLPIPQVILKLLKNHYLLLPKRFWNITCGKGKRTKSRIESPYLFPSKINPKIRTKTVSNLFNSVLKAQGLWKIKYISKKGKPVPKFRFYTLRHSFASKLYNQYKDIFLVSNMLGHRRIESSKIYVHTDKDYQMYQRKALNNMMSVKMEVEQ